MTENVETAIFEILKRIQKDIAENATRLERVEETTRKQRRDTAGILVVMKSVAGEFTERLVELESEIDLVEQRMVAVESYLERQGPFTP